VHNQAEAYGQLPSDILGLETAWGAFQFNEICLMVGRRVEKNVNEGKDAFSDLGGGMIGAMKRGYKSARAFVKKKMKIPESGVW
jgi:hypothetical protein